MEVCLSAPSHLRISSQEAFISSQTAFLIFVTWYHGPPTAEAIFVPRLGKVHHNLEAVKQPLAPLSPVWSDFLQMPAITGMWLRTAVMGGMQ